MTPDIPISALPLAPTPAAPSPPSPPAPARRQRRWLLVLVVLLVVLAGGAAGSWWAGWWRRTPPLEPPMPQDIRDPEVRAVVEEARDRVVAKPWNAQAWGDYAMILLAHLFDRDADRCFAEAARLDPHNPRWPYGRAQIALKRDPDQSIGLLRQAAALAETDPQFRSPCRLQLAEALQEREQLVEAEQLFQVEWQEHPGDPRAGFGLGLIALARQDTAAARGYLLAARSSPSGHKRATFQLAALARLAGDEHAAEAYDREVVRMSDEPPWPDPLLDEVVTLVVGRRLHERRIKQLEEKGRFAEALKIYEQLLAQERTANDCVGAAVNLARLGQFDKAEAFLDEAVRLEPDNGQAHYTLGLTRFTRAEKAWARSPGSAEARAAFRQALASCQRAAELKPNIARNYLYWGLALKFLGEPEAGLAPLARGIACQPTSFDLHLAMAEVLLDAVPPEERRLAAALAPSGLSRVFLCRSRYAEAESHLDIAARLIPDDSHTATARRRLPWNMAP